MREIKFRAWDKESKNMVSGFNPFYRGNISSDGEHFLSVDGSIAPDDRAVFMQYTGLKDKNNVEIYEGDIVKPLRGGLKNVILIITYCEIELCFYAIIPSKGRGYRRLRITANKHFEVIGNIHENPELLK